MESNSLRDAFSRHPEILKSYRNLSRQTYNSTSDIFYNKECGKNITRVELKSYIESDPNQYKIFLYDFKYEGINMEVLSFTSCKNVI